MSLSRCTGPDPQSAVSCFAGNIPEKLGTSSTVKLGKDGFCWMSRRVLPVGSFVSNCRHLKRVMEPKPDVSGSGVNPPAVVEVFLPLTHDRSWGKS